MADMQKEIAEAIKKSLPQHVGEMLSKELEEYAELRESYEVLKRNFRNKAEALALAQSEHDEMVKMRTDAKDVLDRERIVAERERIINEHDLKVKLNAANIIAAHAHEFVGLVFKSPVYRKSFVNHMDTTYSPTGIAETKAGSPIEETKTEE